MLVYDQGHKLIIGTTALCGSSSQAIMCWCVAQMQFVLRLQPLLACTRHCPVSVYVFLLTHEERSMAQNTGGGVANHPVEAWFINFHAPFEAFIIV